MKPLNKIQLDIYVKEKVASEFYLNFYKKFTEKIKNNIFYKFFLNKHGKYEVKI